MATLNTYLNFNGDCEAAFDFYKSVFGGEFTSLNRYEEMSSEKPLSEAYKKKIMHISLPIKDNVQLMGADMSEAFDTKSHFGDNVSLYLEADSEEEAKELFKALSEGGKIIMAQEKVFWGALFGNFEDKFGIFWMVSYMYDKSSK